MLSGAHSFWHRHTPRGNLVTYDSTNSTAHWSTVPLQHDRDWTYSRAFLCKRNRKITEFVCLNAVETESNALVLTNASLHVMCFYNWWVSNNFKKLFTHSNKKEEDGSSDFGAQGDFQVRFNSLCKGAASAIGIKPPKTGEYIISPVSD